MTEVPVMINHAEAEAAAEDLLLPPGFGFHPTDEVIISHYLTPKVFNPLFDPVVMGEVNLYNCEPWDLPAKAKMGEREWYFCHKDCKYPTRTRNYATASGYWKATGKDKKILRGRGVLVGMKTILVFYRGRAPRGEKTGWVTHEYRLDGKMPHPPPRSDKEWVVCRVFYMPAVADAEVDAESSSANRNERPSTLETMEPAFKRKKKIEYMGKRQFWCRSVGERITRWKLYTTETAIRMFETYNKQLLG